LVVLVLLLLLLRWRDGTSVKKAPVPPLLSLSSALSPLAEAGGAGGGLLPAADAAAGLWFGYTRLRMKDATTDVI